MVKAVKNVPQERISERTGEQTTVLRQGYCRRAGCDAATGPSDSDVFEDCESPAGAVHRQSGGCASDHADHSVAGATGHSAHRQGDRGARGDATTGTSNLEGVEDRGTSTVTAHRHSCGGAVDLAHQPGVQACRVPDSLDRVLLCTAMTFIDEQIATSIVPMTQARLVEVVASVPELLALRVEENQVEVPDPPIQERIAAVVADILKHLVPRTGKLIEDMLEQNVDVPVLPTRKHGDEGGEAFSALGVAPRSADVASALAWLASSSHGEARAGIC